VVVEATRTIGDADLGAEDEGCAFIKHSAGEVEGCHRIVRWMLDKHPRGGEFVGRVLPRLGTRRCKGTQGFRQVRAAESAISYVLCGLYCL
jgi:hypothetical protein